MISDKVKLSMIFFVLGIVLSSVFWTTKIVDSREIEVSKVADRVESMFLNGNFAYSGYADKLTIKELRKYYALYNIGTNKIARLALEHVIYSVLYGNDDSPKYNLTAYDANVSISQESLITCFLENAVKE